MDEDLKGQLQRWQDAEADGRDDEADGLCRMLVSGAAPEPALSREFTASTLAAIGEARVRDARRAGRVRRWALLGGIAASVAGLYAGGPWMLSLASGAVIGAINLLVKTTVWLVSVMQTGTDVWSVLAGLGRATAAFVANPAVTVAMLAMQGIAIAALIALQRLLGADRESFK
jgi:hypothetical protein